RVIKAFAIHLRGVGLVKPGSHLGGELKLVIAGQKGWLFDEIYKLPKKLGIEDRVKFLGYVADEELPALYSGAQALVFPSLFEGFGLPILEAQASGCPVITSNISSMPDVAGKGAIYVDPYNTDDIVDAMIRVKGKEEREKLIKKGFENIKRFSWEKCAAQTLEVFEQVYR
ncbi:glycosyltransferase family 4 protein, partial [Candidatus Daviesbacteria bacterium]|nr:glycosyltransferase family 4 protein [Candidatus Daviesbacteria bacterium]